jgi:hypothetical protein
MALLKEEGSLDIDKYESLPLEEWMVEMGKLTHEQVMEYLSKVVSVSALVPCTN